MQIRMIWTIRIQILTIRQGFEPFEKDWKHSNADLNHSKRIGSIRMQIRTIWKVFKSFERNFYLFDEAFECKFEPLEKDSKHSNPNSSHSNQNLNHSNQKSNHSK